MTALDWGALERAQLSQTPFPHLAIAQVLTQGAREALAAEYPTIRSAGSFSLADARPGPALRDLVADLQSPRFRMEMERIFGLDLRDKPAVITLRGQASSRDGRIHVDSRSKLLSLLLYMNPQWSGSDGQLRLVHNGQDIEAVGREIPATLGSLVAFPRVDNSWHGHTRFIGERRVLQLNYLRSEHASLVANIRHRISALSKHKVA